MATEIELEGEHATSIKIKIGEIEDLTKEQVQEMGNQIAYDGDIRIMPDGHPGKGSVVGFTMPVGQKVVPNNVGVDIGCGMSAFKLPGHPDIYDWDHRAILDKAIRERVPVGYHTHDNSDFNMHTDFPWDVCQEKLENFNEHSDFEDIEVEYGPEYFDDLMERVYGGTHKTSHVISSVGTLGGGNHFVEIGESQNTGDYWAIIHSGSRNIGLSICEYHQEVAAKIHDERADEAREFLEQYPEDYVKFDADEVGDKELLDWLQGGMGEDFINYEAIPKEDREIVRGELKDAVPEGKYNGSDYDYLEGEHAHAYIIDMIYAQTYASLSRRHMGEYVLDAWFTEFFDGHLGPRDMPDEFQGDELEFADTVESTHNYIDFEDQIIRKGATRAHEGERAIVPYNMRDGTLIVEGKGNPDWNYSINHGAGRVDSRGWAGHEITQEEANEEIEESDVFASIVPRDEAPHAYKDWKRIEEAMAPSASIVDRIKPLLNIKAETRYYDEV